jgi:hypothetical protein
VITAIRKNSSLLKFAHIVSAEIEWNPLTYTDDAPEYRRSWTGMA